MLVNVALPTIQRPMWRFFSKWKKRPKERKKKEKKIIAPPMLLSILLKCLPHKLNQQYVKKTFSNACWQILVANLYVKKIESVQNIV